MKYTLKINQHNIKPHLDIEQDIQKQKNGLFTFNLRVSQGNIEDYAKFRTITYTEYRSVIFTTIKESIPAHDLGKGSTEPAIRPDKR